MIDQIKSQIGQRGFIFVDLARDIIRKVAQKNEIELKGMFIDPDNKELRFVLEDATLIAKEVTFQEMMVNLDEAQFTWKAVQRPLYKSHIKELEAISIAPRNIHRSWDDFLFNPKILRMLRKIETEIGSEFAPLPEEVLRFMGQNLYALKAVIIAMDPYPQLSKTQGRPVATGRAFEVGDLLFWDQPFRQASLRNIVRLLYKTYNGIQSYQDIPKFKEILTEIESGKFTIKPPGELFKDWEKQGVLLLNAALTCEIGKPGSHSRVWADFVAELIKYISSEQKSCHWLLWGNNARALEEYIVSGRVVSSNHPMMCSSKAKTDFLVSDCFLVTKDRVDWLGQMYRD